MFRILIIAAACFLIYKLFMGDRNKQAAKEKKQEEKLASTGELVADPTCGTYVRSDSPIRVKDEQGVHHFCSYECRDAYLKNREIEGK